MKTECLKSINDYDEPLDADDYAANHFFISTKIVYEYSKIGTEMNDETPNTTMAGN